MQIVDRRENPKGRSVPNRGRFLRRAKQFIQDAVKQQSGTRGLKETAEGGEVSISSDGIREPILRRESSGSGVRERVLPGNKDFVAGDQRPRPRSGGRGSEGAKSGDGEDAFRFVLSRGESLSLYLDDLELPELAKRMLKEGEVISLERAGYSVSGSPANLSVTRTMRNSLSRRIALRRPKPAEVEALEAEIDSLVGKPEQADRLKALQRELEQCRSRARNIPYIDPIDVRYRRFNPVPKPVTQAVMFCLMDVSGSMSEDMKDLAKRFYTLLYLFLQRKYKHVSVVFIRHTHLAQEVDEKTFFYSRDTGGTVVSTALDEMRKVIAARYPISDWNIYAAQASDGDNTPGDEEVTARLLVDSILPACQHYAYIEVSEDTDSGFSYDRGATAVWQTYSRINAGGGKIAMKKVKHRRDIFPVFRELFSRGGAEEAAAVRGWGRVEA